jgi:regulator of cell morphogenesis and NO signaling
MTMIDTTTTLGDLVTAHPRLAGELERRGLDYCCGGRRSLGDASRGAGLDPIVVAAELTDAAETGGDDGAPPWAEMGIVELTEHIVDTHHRYLWGELPRVEALVAKIAGVHGGRHPELMEVWQLVTELRTDLEQHLAKEERVLFPAVRALAADSPVPDLRFGRIADPIGMMLLEHDRAGDLLADLRRATDDYEVPDDGCASYRACYQALAEIDADTRLHVHKENNVLFPAVLRVEDERSAVSPARGGQPRRPAPAR